MDDAGHQDSEDDLYTLLCVRADGVAPVVDLVASAGLLQVRARARALLKEHASCDTVEVWCGGTMVEQLGRA